MKINEKLLDKNKKYVIGVSGGCDSMFLLNSLHKLGYHLFVAHVNYNYRHDSYIDYELVFKYCHKKHIPFYYREYSEEDYHEGNFQDRARTLRYDFYKEIYDLHHCDGLILGHHRDDHLESIYMQLSRHNTIHYLGIKEENVVKGMNVLRPLMNCYKDDILSECKKQKIPYHDDYTNFETDFERDKVRNLVLSTYTLQQKEDLLKKADEHNKRINDLEKQVKPYYDQYHNHHSIEYHTIPDHLKNIFLYLLLNDIMHSSLISESLILEINHQLCSDKPNIQMNLPVNYLFIKEYDNIYIIEESQTKEYSYVIEEKTCFECEHFRLSDHGHINEGVFLSDDDFPITIRTMKSGDRIETSSGTKKLSRLFINAKVPALKRKTWPVVLNKDKTIVLVPHIAKNIDYLTTKPNIFVLK